MNLPKLFTAHDQSGEPRLVLCLAISNTRLQALLLRVGDAQTTIVEKSRVLEYADAAAALVKADEALQDLGPESESLNQIIFCFESSWVKDGDIAETKRPLVKKITTELSLEPLGFIVISEALAHYYVQQNALFSGLLFLFTTDHVMVNLVSQGVIKHAESVGRSDNAVADVEEALARFALKSKTETQLPPKMVLASFDLNAEELRKQQQQLLDYSWDGQKLFLQTPTIDVVPPEAFVTVMALEAARAVALAHGLPVPQSSNHSTTVSVTAPRSSFTEPATTTLDSVQPELVEVEPEADLDIDPDETEAEAEQEATANSSQELAVEPAVTTFGIPISAAKIAAAPELESAESGDFSSDFAVVPTASKSAGKSDSKTGLNWLSALNKPYHGRRSVGFFAIIGVLAGVLVLGIVAVMSVLFMTSAQLQVTLSKQLVSKEVEITLDPTATTTDPEARVLAAKKVTKVLEDQSSMSTTGTLLVGDKAKGKVRLFNKTSSEKTFAAGSTFTSKNLSFKLDSAVTVASASSHTTGETKKITFGNADGTVTASAIGDESNLKKDVELVIDSFSTDTFSALVVDGLAGGASREVRVVAAADRAELLKDLRGELLLKANSEFAAQSKDGTYFLPNARITKETPSYSAKEGDEATQLTLSLSIEVEALSYTAADLQPIAKQVLSAEVPAGFELVGEDPQILSAPDTSAASGSGKLKLNANISSAAYPTVVESELIKIVLGKSLETAQADLEALDTVSSATVMLQPSFIQSIRTTLPNDEQRIHLRLIRE